MGWLVRRRWKHKASFSLAGVLQQAAVRRLAYRVSNRLVMDHRLLLLRLSIGLLMHGLLVVMDVDWLDLLRVRLGLLLRIQLLLRMQLQLLLQQLLLLLRTRLDLGRIELRLDRLSVLR